MRSLRLSYEQVQMIVEHARRDQPNEACGIIAGKADLAARIIPIQNTAHDSKHHYQMDASELLQTLKNIEAAGEELVGIYHSHLAHEPIPSAEDIREAQINTPNVVHLIVSLKYGKAGLQAWHIHDNRVDRVELLLGNQLSSALPAITQTQIIAIIVASILAVVLLLIISFSLLPPAPPIPTPQ